MTDRKCREIVLECYGSSSCVSSCVGVLLPFCEWVSDWVTRATPQLPWSACTMITEFHWLVGSICYWVKVINTTLGLIIMSQIGLFAMATKRQSEFVSISPTDGSTTLVLINHVVCVTLDSGLFGLLWLQCLVNIMLTLWTTDTWLIDLVSYIKCEWLNHTRVSEVTVT